MTDVIVVDKEKKIEIRMVPVDRIVCNDYNPNTMNDAMFNELVRDMEQGFLQPILVVPFKDEDGKTMLRIVDGEHRYNGMMTIGMSEIPCVVARGDLSESERAQMIKTVRMNKIRGGLNQKKFDSLVNRLASEMPLDELAEEFIMDPGELEKLISQEREKLPNEDMKKALDAAKNEIKTVDDLSTVLNNLFAKYGDSVQFNYMVIDWGGREHLWVRLKDKKEYIGLRKKCEMIRSHGVTADSVIMHVINTYLVEEFVKENLGKFAIPEVAS